jgi:hypothetical protein
MKPNVIAAGNHKLADEIKKILDLVDHKLQMEGQMPEQLLNK